MQNDQERWSRIGALAAELCYRSPSTCQDNICVGSCAAVCPGPDFLLKARDIVFTEYWKNHKNSFNSVEDRI